jgi:hypothetical protein
MTFAKSFKQDTVLTPQSGIVDASSAALLTNGLNLNKTTLTSSFTFPVGFNASSVGPITLGNGVTITVPSGSRWLVL